MCKAVEELAETWAEERRLDAMFAVVKNLMDTMKWSAEQAMDAARVSDDDRVILLKRF